MKLSDRQFEKNYSILIVGDVGSGKTTLAATAPGKVCYLCFEDGLDSIVLNPDAHARVEYFEYYPAPHLPVAATEYDKQTMPNYAGKSWEEAMKKAISLSSSCDFDVIVIDSLTSMSQVCFESILAENNLLNKPPRQDSRTIYQTLGMQCFQFFYGILGLPCAKIFVAHESYERNDMTGSLNYRIAAEGRMFSDRISTGKDFGEIWRTELITTDAEPSYRVRTRASAKFPAKSRWGCLSELEAPDISCMLQKVKAKFLSNRANARTTVREKEEEETSTPNKKEGQNS